MRAPRTAFSKGQWAEDYVVSFKVEHYVTVSAVSPEMARKKAERDLAGRFPNARLEHVETEKVT